MGTFVCFVYLLIHSLIHVLWFILCVNLTRSKDTQIFGQARIPRYLVKHSGCFCEGVLDQINV